MDVEHAKSELSDLTRALSSNGAVGTIPDWYTKLRYAQYLCVPPWEVDEAIVEHREWFDRATVAMEAENRVKREARHKRREVVIRDGGRPDIDGVPIPRVDAVAKQRVGE